jgi:hypothetical protein
MAFTQHESRELSVGEFPSVPRVPPRTSGFRTKWHTLSSSARGLLCFCPADHACKDDWPSDSIVDLNTPARSDVSWQSSRDGTAPLNGMRSRLYQDRTGKVAKHEGRKAVRDKTTTVTTTEHKPSSNAVSSVNAPPIKQRDARRHGLASPLCDHAALLHLNGSRTRGERTGHDVATGDTVEALIDAILQIGDSQGCGSAASLGMPLGIEVGPEEKATTNDGKSKGKKESSAGAWEDTDARRAAWEAMKRRVMHIEEYGALPPEDSDEDDAGDAPDAAEAMDHNAERASRECRAWRRRRWAEEAIRGQAREDASRRAVAKKRRRYAGWWIHENEVFARLVREIFQFSLPSCRQDGVSHLWTHPFFTRFAVRASNMRPIKANLQKRATGSPVYILSEEHLRVLTGVGSCKVFSKTLCILSSLT